ncbi:MAG: hypothetical protein K2X93_18040 [Candidatus Obscuribacterales bacterium]|nr:hypothetical protein [Candidatus Obscuribacterales bacterium]
MATYARLYRPACDGKNPLRNTISYLVSVAAVLIALSEGSLQAKTDPDWVEDPKEETSGQVEVKDGQTILKLGVKHSNSMNPVPDSLQAGSLFDDSMLLDDTVSLLWYPIPSWLAGTWKRNTETTVFTHDYASGYSNRQTRTFMSEQTADFGVQKDKKGVIWNCNLANRGVSDRGSYRSVAIVKSKEPLKSSEGEVIFREVFTVVHVVKESNLIVDSFLIESLTRHRPLMDGSLKTEMSVKVYNPSGTPRQVQENVAHELPIKRFVLLDRYKDKNLKAEFADFLRTKGLDNLIPD